MDRSIVYTQELPRTVDFLNACKFAMMGEGYAMQGCLGFNYTAGPYPTNPLPPYVHGLGCTPTIPTADLNIHIGTGAIYTIDPVDQNAYGDLGTDATHSILKQGILNDPVTMLITPPSTPGYSQIYLVEAILNDVDTGSAVLPYYNSANPAAPYSGPNNSGTSQYTIRTSACAVTLKAGTAAPTGSQVAPAPDVGYVGLYQITVTYGQTQITSANIAVSPTAPFFPTLPSIPVHIQNGDWISADDTGSQNALVLSPFPAISGLLKYQKFRFKIKNSNSGPSTLTVSGFTGGLYYAGQTTNQLPANALVANTIAEAICDGINFELTASNITINNNTYSSGTTSGLVALQVFTNSGTYTPSSGATKAIVFATGGGGGGGSSCGGGAAGATAIVLTPAVSTPVTIGAGGGARANGGQTSFGSVAVAGGGGASPNNNGGVGGVATAGLLLIRGGDGDTSNNNNSGGSGGASYWGGGAATANNARAWGAGGGGTTGAGQSGVVFIMEF